MSRPSCLCLSGEGDPTRRAGSTFLPTRCHVDGAQLFACGSPCQGSLATRPEPERQPRSLLPRLAERGAMGAKARLSGKAPAGQTELSDILRASLACPHSSCLPLWAGEGDKEAATPQAGG